MFFFFMTIWFKNYYILAIPYLIKLIQLFYNTFNFALDTLKNRTKFQYSDKNLVDKTSSMSYHSYYWCATDEMISPWIFSIW